MSMSQQNMEPGQEIWTRIATREEFIACFADQLLSGAEAKFVIHASGQITGEISGQGLSGSWYWQDGLFWRHAMLDGKDLGWDSEVIERSGEKMRYMPEGGLGAGVIVTLCPPPCSAAV